MHPDSAQALIDANVHMLLNFLDALPLVSLKPKRILLQTGGKKYGMHVDRVRTPLVESDPQPEHFVKNFYYHQQDLLFDYCNAHPEEYWNIVRPFGVIGAAPNAVMTMMVSFAIYTLIQRQKGESLYFDGDFDSWEFEIARSPAVITGFISGWVVLKDKCANQAFNAMDGSPLSWDRFFHEVARCFGIGRVVGPEADDKKYSSWPMATLSENKDNWTKIMQRTGDSGVNPWSSDPQGAMSGDFAYLHFGLPSHNKVRRFGFNGVFDSLESAFEMYQDMESLGALPSMQVKAANPLI